MTGLSECLFDLCEEDIAAIKDRKRKEGKMSDEEINRLPRSYFKKRYTCGTIYSRCRFSKQMQ